MIQRITLILSILAITFSGIAQVQVQGVVYSESDNTTLTGVNIFIEGTQTGTISDVNGRFSLDVPGGETFLTFSFIGFNTNTLLVKGDTFVNIYLKDSFDELDEIVVIGYGVQKKSLVTGSISKLSDDELVNNQPGRLEQAIQGKTAGVLVSAASGSPGGNITVRIRGTNSNKNSNPIYIVDGIKTGGIEYLAPEDIKSVEVLKDAASTAIYGAEGGNGVVIITTKTGRKNFKQVDYNFYTGVQHFNNNMEMMDAGKYADYYTKAIEYEFRDQYSSLPGSIVDLLIQQEYDKYLIPGTDSALALQANTNWLDEITSPAPVQSHHLSFSGGTDKITVSSSVSYFDQTGISGGENSSFKRYTARLNADYKPNEWITVGARGTASRRTRAFLSENNAFGGQFLNAMLMDPLTPAVHQSDTLVYPVYRDSALFERFVRDGDGRAYGMSNRVVNEVINPVAYMNNENEKNTIDKVLLGGYLQVEPYEGLTFRTSVDVDHEVNVREDWEGVSYYNTSNEKDNYDREKELTVTNAWQWDNIATYTKEINKHYFTVLGGSSLWEQDGFRHYKVEAGFPVTDSLGKIIYPTSADSIIQDVHRLYDQERKASFFARVQYNYNEKYLFNASIRRDGSSKFAVGNQFGVFPAVSVGWVLTNEDFWPLPFINHAKIRYSYGKNGSLGTTDPFEYVSTIDTLGHIYTTPTGAVTGATPAQLSNNELVWEATAMNDIGMDLHFFDNMITTSLSYYISTTENLLASAPIPEYVGNSKPEANVGVVVNKGFEVEVGFKMKRGDFAMNINANASFMENMVTKFPSAVQGYRFGTDGPVTYARQDRPLWYFYGFKTNGVWRDSADVYNNNYIRFETDGVRDSIEIQQGAMPGDVKIVDVENDSTITDEDRTYIGSPHPDINCGLSFNISYKGIDFGATITGTFGSDIYWGIYRSDLRFTNKPVEFYENAWSPDNPDATFYRPTYADTWNLKHNDMYVKDGSYIRLRNIQLGYTLPKKWMEAMHVQKLRLYVSCDNLVTITKYPGLDPEIGNTGNEFAVQSGDRQFNAIRIDQGFYPTPTVYKIGLNLSF